MFLNKNLFYCWENWIMELMDLLFLILFMKEIEKSQKPYFLEKMEKKCVVVFHFSVIFFCFVVLVLRSWAYCWENCIMELIDLLFLILFMKEIEKIPKALIFGKMEKKSVVVFLFSVIFFCFIVLRFSTFLSIVDPYFCWKSANV